MTGPVRPPRTFAVDDPALTQTDTPPEPAATDAASDDPDQAPRRLDTPHARRSLVSWGGILLGAASGLFVLAAGLWVARFVGIALERQDWVGWLAAGLLGIAGLAALVLALREVLGFLRLGRLAGVRRSVERALGTHPAEERAAVRHVKALFAHRGELAWPMARLARHERDVRDPGELLRLAERELVTPLDAMARRHIVASAKRVGVVTAMSPAALISVLFVLYENLRLLRGVAALYGGRPGTLGGFRLARMVMTHIVATGGIALTDDLVGQFLGQDALRRVSRRLGEGAFNGALTARIGVAAIQVCRPMPFIEATPVRLRDLLPELYRVSRKDAREAAERKTSPGA